MTVLTEAEKAAAKLKQAAKNIRPSAEGTNDWLDDISDTLTNATKLLGEKVKQHPESKTDFLPVLEQLLQLTLRTIMLRHDVVSGQPPRGPIDTAGTSGDDGGMEARIAALEKDMATVKTDVAIIRSNYATKEDLHKELHTMTWKIIGAIGLICAVVYFIAKTVH